MHDSPKRSPRPDREVRPDPRPGERRERSTAGERRDAIRRWIDDDDDDACRGID
ncbi:MAG TPA: hypothetical protein VMJ10_12785 [Kofleriaceae bacterium]|nr:hypothetical protein [Kofleriaceae bacterium]